MKHVCRLGLALAVVAAMLTPAAADDKRKTVPGKVTAVSSESFTIAKGSESMTFTVDTTTKITGQGLPTKSTEKAAAGEKMTLSDSVATGDMVSVSYHDMDGKMHAANIKVTQKALSVTK